MFADMKEELVKQQTMFDRAQEQAERIEKARLMNWRR